jgi:hypothetical protein
VSTLPVSLLRSASICRKFSDAPKMLEPAETVDAEHQAARLEIEAELSVARVALAVTEVAADECG